MSLSNKNFTQTEIGLIPDDWKVTITKKCLSIPITDGPHETPILYEDGIPFISAESVSSGNGRIDFSRMRGYISEEYHQECCKKYKPQKNDVYIIKSGSTTGKVAIVKTDQVFNIWSPLAVLRAKQDIVPDYLFYAVQSSYYQEQIIQAWGMGTQQNIGMRTLEHLKVAYPEYDEQHAIATTLSDMDALIEAKTALLEKKRAIKQGAMQELLTGRRRLPGFAVTPMKQTDIGEIPEDWEVRELGSLVDICSAKRVLQSQWKSDGIPFYRTREIIVLAEQGSVENELYISQELYKRNSCICPAPTEGDIMLTAVGTIGKTYLVREGDCFYYKDASVLCLRNQRKIVPGYLNLQLSYVTVQNQINGDSDGTTVKTITINKAKKYLIPVPSSTLEQERIHEVIQDQDNEIRSLQKELSKLSCIKQGMMQNLLTGRIRLVK